MIGAQNWENGDELSNCFLGRRWLDCPLPCALRLRTQRPDHLAVGEDGCNVRVKRDWQQNATYSITSVGAGKQRRGELANRPSSRAYEWFGTTTVTHNAVKAAASLYIVVTTTSPAVART